MTTRTERSRASPAGATGASTLRLYLIALLAAAYVTAFWLLGMEAPAKPTETRAASGPTPKASAGPGNATWFHDLPTAARPAVNLPAGWHIADPTVSSPNTPAMTERALPVPVRVSSVRTRRIRTRSS